MTATSYGTGLYKSGEDHALFAPRLGLPGTKPGVIHAHGYTPTIAGLTASYLTTFREEPEALADLGYRSLAADLGGGGTWGNAAADAGMDAALTFLRGAGGANSAPVGIVGGSMGGATALNWARQHLAQVSVIALLIPAVDLEDIRANNRGFSGGYQAPLEAAYGGAAAWLAARPTRNPVQFAAELAAIPVHIWYSNNDPICVPATMTAFAAAHGNTTLVNIGDAGHSAVAVAGADLAAWMAGYLG